MTDKETNDQMAVHVADVNILPDDEAPPISRQPSNVDIIAAANEVREVMRRESELHLTAKDGKDEKNDDASDDLRQAYSTEAHKMSDEELAKEYSTSLQDGLTDSQLKAAFEKFGKNELTPRESEPEWIKVLKAIFSGFFNVLLWLGSILSFIGYLIDPSKDPANLYIAIVLAFVVTVTGLFSYYQDSKSDAIMEGFKNFLPQHVKVTRNGVEMQIEAVELVPGDLIALDFGDKIPADVRVISASKDLQVDNSSLTGESDPQERAAKMTHESPMETKNLAFFGTLILKGRGKGIVINTGDKTLMGRIAKLADSTAQVETPISLEIKDFVFKVSAVAITLGVVFFVVAMIRNPDPIRSFVFLIGIIVANVPEGLLATVTVSLTLTAQRMASKNVLVKNLEAVETLGSTSVICSDKTGTLTTNIMTVAHVYYNRTHFECDTSDSSKGQFDAATPEFGSLTQIAVLCNNARFVDGKIAGDASETALVKFADYHYGHDIASYRERYSQKFAIPFNSGNKWQLGIHTDANNADQWLAVLKGAPEKVLDYCDRCLVDGQNLVLTDELKNGIFDDISVLSNKGERVLGFCRMYLSKSEYPEGFEFEGDNISNCNFPFNQDGDAKGFVFVGLMSMIDPPRPGVPEAVASCQSAGIKVIMVTGDHPSTARAIARKVGIIQNMTRDEIAAERGIKEEAIGDEEVKAIVVHGQQLEQIFTLSEDEVTLFWNDTLLKPNVVFARTSPQQKLLIVQACQERGGIVAVTGDGVNDSPALKKADIGVAMGITGTDVSKDAADMILLDDNFASIVKGVEEGRIIFDNLKKSIAYTLSSNIPEIAPFLFYAVGGFPLPLSTVLILCVDLGTDMMPAISMAHEGREANIMSRKPRNPATDNLVTWRLISFAYLQIGVLQALAGFYAYMAVLADYGLPPSAIPGLDFNNEFLDTSKLLCCTGTNPTADACSFIGASSTCAAGASVNLDAGTRKMMLETAQTAYFISIIIVQWADLLICKTRVLSILEHGMRNNFMNRSILFETLLGVCIAYIPFVNLIGTRPLKFYFWFPAIPFNFCIFLYDETRKWWIRKNQNGWLHRTTYW